MRRIWVYQGEFGPGKDFQWMSVAQFKRTFSVGQALGFLGQIRKSVQQEAKELPREGDYYAPIRYTFAEIDGLAKLFRGERGKDDPAKNAVAFGIEYLGRVNERYRQLFGLVFDMYRHGLAHTHMTKCVKFRDAQNRWVTLGWGINDTPSDRHVHLTVEQREAYYFRLWLHPPQLVDDALQAIDYYCSDLSTKGNKSKLFARFKRGYLGTAAVFQEPPAPSPPGAPPQKGRQPGKKKRRKQARPLTLNQYSSDGIAWIRKQIASGEAWSADRP